LTSCLCKAEVHLESHPTRNTKLRMIRPTPRWHIVRLQIDDGLQPLIVVLVNNAGDTAVAAN
jgi:hypothetical protein